MLLKKTRILILIRFVWFGMVVSPWMLPLQGHADDHLSIETLVTGANQSRQVIRSGELHIRTHTVFFPKHSSIEQEDAVLEQQRQELIEKLGALNIHGGYSQLDCLLKEAELRHFDEDHLIEEQNVAFQILDDSVTKMRPVNYRYRVVMLDRENADTRRSETALWRSGMYALLYYDGEYQILERESPVAQPTAILYDKPKLRGFQPLHLFGRASYQIPEQGVRYLGREQIGDHNCYIIEYRIPDTGAIVRLWVCPTLDFSCIREEQHYEGQLVKSTHFDGFKQFGDIWYPTRYMWRVSRRNGEIGTLIETSIDYAEFNVMFPDDFFAVNPEQILDSSLVIHPLSNVDFKPSYAVDVPNLECGPRSLVEICRLYNVPADFDEIARLSGYDPRQGTSMLGLQQAAVRKGLKAMGMRMNLKSLLQSLPAIVHVNNDHFMVVRSIEDDQILVYDPMNQYSVISQAEFLRMWNGKVLTFEVEGLPRVERKQADITEQHGPRILFDGTTYDFGKTQDGEIKHTFTFTNIGTAPLEIGDVDTDCRCTVVTPSKNHIAPGEQGTIEATISVGQKIGQLKGTLRVHSNDPENAVVQLTIRGVVFTSIQAIPTQIMVGAVTIDNELYREATLLLEEEGIELLSAKGSQEYLVPELIQSPQPSKYILRVHVKETVPIGPLNEDVVITYRDHDQQKTIVLPVRGEILGDVIITPRKLFLGAISVNSPARKSLHVQVRSPEISIREVKSSSQHITVTYRQLSEANRYEIMVSVDPQISADELPGALVLVTTSAKQPQIEIPVYGIKLASQTQESGEADDG